MKLGNKILEGDVLAAARLISDVENDLPSAIKELESLYPHTGRAYILGIAGAPGAGKSTLLNTLINIFRQKKMTIGVVAIDPTSPFSGGAVLGDRIRMQGYGVDKDVFIRSLASRGWKGGLSRVTINAIHIMDAMGKDIIFIEAVGSGQGEVDIARVADTSILILTPGMGDEIQMMKAGILEAADIFVVNKADRDGANSLKARLEVMLGMKARLPGEWQPGIILTEAISGKGTEQLAEEILRHRAFLTSSQELEKRCKERARLELTMAVESYLKHRIERMDKGYLEKLVDDLAHRKINPRSALSKIINLSEDR
ncbi:MAG: methylmalonyl Co-A mutase-associated GTPase MeaB [Chloroflexi bacterium]|nr:methylmalonyl Co-A mutase-associated GTPase MeaB [Chloroflexota bacterium]